MLLAYSMEYRLIPETWYEVRKKDWIMPWEGNHILVELPIREPEKTGSIEPVTEIRQLVAEGYQPVLAHPERYLYLSIEEYMALKAAGAQFQQNLGSVEGFYGNAVSERAAELNASGMYEWNGTDLHSRKHADFLDHFVFGRT